MRGRLVIDIVLAAAAVISAVYAGGSYYLNRSLVASTKVPHLQIRLAKFLRDNPHPGYGTIIYEIFNHTDSPAKQVEADFRISTNDWIQEWSKGRIRELESKGNEMTIKEANELKSRKEHTKPKEELEGFKGILMATTGAIPNDICSEAKKSDGYPITSRLTWQSEKGQRFEEQEEYKLVY